MWDPETYERYAAERARPFTDLLAQVQVPHAQRVVDLGCGTGALTARLAARWPGALVLGVDSSAEMLAAASGRSIPGRLEFRRQDLRELVAEEPYDVIVSNATLQWVPGHRSQLTRLAGFLAPGGVLAFQVPDNFHEPSHRLLAEIVGRPRWRDRVQAARIARPGVGTSEEYLETLAEAGLAPTVWETTYVQVLAGEHAVLEWMRGTALRPVLAVLGDGPEAEAFLAEYGAALEEAYPPGAHGTVLPYRRIFAVGRAGGGPAPSVVTGLDHVQLAMPAGQEAAARRFYGGVLGLAEQPKPPVLAARGGCWFTGPAAAVHLGVDPEFRPARKAHVGLAVADLDAVAGRLHASGTPVSWDEELAPRRRCTTDDPFGNRIELLGPV